MKTIILLVTSFLLMIQSSFAADVVADAAKQSASSDSIVLIFVLGILIVLLFAIIVMLYYMAIALRVINGNKDSVTPLFDLTGAVPIDREHEILMDHEYDGIRELDNNMPTWWKWMFYATVVFSFVYYFYYQFGYGDTQLQEYDQSIVVAEAEMKLHGSKVDEKTATLLTDATSIEAGKTVFMENCVACHGKLGEGGVGPNFTDDYWLHGGDLKSVFKTIKFGVPEKGMIPWQAQLSPVQIQEVASYVLTLKGTNPPNAKAPQGELLEGGVKSDDTKVVDSSSAAPVSDATVIDGDGKTIYMENCVACHGKLGEGGVGPNFTDNYWLHGGDMKSVIKTITFGVPEKGMASWKAQLSEEQIQELANYVLAFKGTNPPNAKAPQGDLVK